MSKLKVVCGFSGKPMGEKDGGGVEGISHGICDGCLAKFFPITYEKCRGLAVTEQDRYPQEEGGSATWLATSETKTSATTTGQ